MLRARFPYARSIRWQRGSTLKLKSINVDEKRRTLLQTSLFSAFAAFMGGNVAGCGSGQDALDSPAPPPPPPPPPPPAPPAPIQSYGPLQNPDLNGLRLPAGFEARIVARSGSTPLLGTGFNWHAAPDGGATFATQDGGWVYVSNSEVANQGGGAGALRFDSTGQLIDAYQILSGTSVNCAGGPTTWGTWLSCEEIARGNVWECDPFGGFVPFRLPALGSFQHEAAAVDPLSGMVYLTEDQTDGRFYRFTPDGITLTGLPDLTTGLLQVAEVIIGLEGAIRWHDISDPAAVVVSTRFQVAASTPFNRGEGLWFDSGFVYMATTGDNRIWAYDVSNESIAVLYDDDFFENPILKGVDNLTISPRGDIFVAEDGDDLQLVAITPNGDIEPVVQIIGHDNSEITGPAFDPSGTRLYFSSQRGATGLSHDGVTFEVQGPFPS